MQEMSLLEKTVLDLLIVIHLLTWLSFIGSVINPRIIPPIVTFKAVITTALWIGLWGIIRYIKKMTK